MKNYNYLQSLQLIVNEAESKLLDAYIELNHVADAEKARNLVDISQTLLSSANSLITALKSTVTIEDHD